MKNLLENPTQNPWKVNNHYEYDKTECRRISKAFSGRDHQVISVSNSKKLEVIHIVGLDTWLNKSNESRNSVIHNLRSEFIKLYS